MKAFFAELLKRLTSRKFLLALGGTVTAIANDEWTAAAAIIIGYLGVNAASEAMNRE